MPLRILLQARLYKGKSEDFQVRKSKPSRLVLAVHSTRKFYKISSQSLL